MSYPQLPERLIQSKRLTKFEKYLDKNGLPANMLKTKAEFVDTKE